MTFRRKPTSSHNYIAKLHDYLIQHPNLETNDINVIHDNWCDVYQNPPGYCNCDPEIKPWEKARH